LDHASGGPVLEGSVGAGSGASAFGWKAGIGTSSRKLPPALGGYTVGVLVQATTATGHEHTLSALPIDSTLAVLRKYNALHWDRSLPPEHRGP
jgi:D-aminopeptidase